MKNTTRQSIMRRLILSPSQSDTFNDVFDRMVDSGCIVPIEKGWHTIDEEKDIPHEENEPDAGWQYFIEAGLLTHERLRRQREADEKSLAEFYENANSIILKLHQEKPEIRETKDSRTPRRRAYMMSLGLIES